MAMLNNQMVMYVWGIVNIPSSTLATVTLRLTLTYIHIHMYITYIIWYVPRTPSKNHFCSKKVLVPKGGSKNHEELGPCQAFP